MQSPIYDNQSSTRSAMSWLEKALKNGQSLDVASAYFTVHAFYRLKDELNALERVRFLFGEPRFVKHVDPARDVAVGSLEGGEFSIQHQLQLTPQVLSTIAWLEKDSVEVRSLQEGRLLHGKMYGVTQRNGVFEALLGSSNFTLSGLGESKGGRGNLELNLEVNDRRDALALGDWFGEIWNDDSQTEDVKARVIGYLKALYGPQSPAFVYYKTVFELLGAELHQRRTIAERDERGWKDSAIYNQLFPFQKIGAHALIHKLLEHGGCILADSVGLGKTYTALAVMRYWEKVRGGNVLVLAPKKLLPNWETFGHHKHNPLGEAMNFQLRAHTDLGRDALKDFAWSDFDLIVIDESHNFRNSHMGRDGKLSRYGHLMESVIRAHRKKAGHPAHVLLLSATPVNTQFGDLRSQIQLFSDGDDAAFEAKLGVSSLDGLSKVAQKAFNEWMKLPGAARTQKELLERLPNGVFSLLDGVSVARSRRQIERFYSMEEIGEFPKRLPTLSLQPEIDRAGRFPGFEALHKRISNYQLTLFKPSQFLRADLSDEIMARYESEKVHNFSQKMREGFLVGMMRMNFLKRLESSVSSFAATLSRTIEKIGALETQIAKWEALSEMERAKITAEIDSAWTTERDDDEEIDAAWDEFSIGKVGYPLSHLRLNDWREALEFDRAQLEHLLRQARDVTPQRDQKLAELRGFLEAHFEAAKETDSTKNEEIFTKNQSGACEAQKRKAIVFTAYADTAKYLFSELKDWSKARGVILGLVTGSGENATTLQIDTRDFNEILTHFSPRSKRRAENGYTNQSEEIDVLIATDCIAEGQNLQDAACVVNYDIHWNPVRLIQRFGRVDRLGSAHENIRMVNFWPAIGLETYIKLQTRVEGRMAMVQLAATADDEDWRDNQLQKLHSEVPDPDDKPGLSLSEVSTEDFLADLAAYLETNREALQYAPPGLFAVLPQLGSGLSRGVVWCLRQKNAAEVEKRRQKRRDGSRFAPPHFLVHIGEDLEIKIAHTQDRKILGILREACAGQKAAFEELCKEFEQSRDEAELRSWVETAIASCCEGEKKASLGALMQRGGLIPTQSQQAQMDWENWEIVTWFVVR